MDNEKWIIVLLIMLWRMPDYSFFHYSLFIIHYYLLLIFISININ